MGTLQATVEAGFRAVREEVKAVHRRIDDRERSAAEWRRHFTGQISRIDRRMDRKRNGKNGDLIPYAKISTLIGLIILGCIGYKWPGALQYSIKTVLPEAIKTFIGG